jgi:hypothetical protein
MVRLTQKWPGNRQAFEPALSAMSGVPTNANRRVVARPWTTLMTRVVCEYVIYKNTAMFTAETYRKGLRHVAFVAFCILFVTLARPAQAQAARMEVIPFESLTLTDQEFLAGREDGKPVTIAGELRPATLR